MSNQTIDLDQLRSMSEFVGKVHDQHTKQWLLTKRTANELAQTIMGIAGSDLSIPIWRGTKIVRQLHELCVEAESKTASSEARRLLESVSVILSIFFRKNL